MIIISCEKSLFLRDYPRMPAHPKILDLRILPNGQHPRPLLPQIVRTYHNILLLVFWRSVHLRTVAPLGLIPTALVKQLPVLLRQVLNKKRNLVTAHLVVLLLQVQQQLQRVRFNK
jgi:hypothetical protein